MGEKVFKNILYIKSSYLRSQFIGVRTKCSTEKSASVASMSLPVSKRARAVLALEGTTRAFHTALNILLYHVMNFLFINFLNFILKLNFSHIL